MTRIAEAREKAAPLTEEELGQALKELREIVNTADPDEDKLLHFGLLRLLATLDALLAELRDREVEIASLKEDLAFVKRAALGD